MASVTTSVPMRGDLQVIRRCARTYRILSVYEKKNVITFLGTDSLVSLMAPNVALGANIQEESQIKSMRFGTSNLSPQRSDIDLAAEAISGGDPVRKEFADANRIIGASGTVEFTATIAAGEGNGITYREAGLFTRGTADDPLVTTSSNMFSRQVFPDQEKTAAVVLDFRWRITFTV